MICFLFYNVTHGKLAWCNLKKSAIFYSYFPCRRLEDILDNFADRVSKPRLFLTDKMLISLGMVICSPSFFILFVWAWHYNLWWRVQIVEVVMRICNTYVMHHRKKGLIKWSMMNLLHDYEFTSDAISKYLL